VSVQIIAGDCRDVLRTLPDASVDSVVTDPPYELGFMGKKWDRSGVANDVRVWAECLRVLKPGGHLVAFGGTRTYHRMVCAIEDAGFEVRDQLGWLYGSGFPKSLDVSKAIDKAAGAEREVIATRFDGVGNTAASLHKTEGFAASRSSVFDITAPATDAARQWQGWGTALKPAWEPIVLARKPLVGTVAENVLQHGTGAMNIDGCRVPGVVDSNPSARGAGNISTSGHRGQSDTGLDRVSDVGRWPANIVHDGSEEVVALFPGEAGAQAPVTVRNADKFRGTYGAFKGNRDEAGSTFKGDTGSAARFFASFPSQSPCSPSSAGTAPANSSLRSALAAFVQGAAATWPNLAGIVSSDWGAPSTSVTENESGALCVAAITAMTSIGNGFSLESQHEERTQCGSRVSVAVKREPTGITTTTASLWRSDGSVERATFTITPTPLDRGGPDFARFNYCAKADRADRNAGLDGMPEKPLLWSSGEQNPGSFQSPNTKRAAQNNHPTVKPTDLMRWLCRLITPPGGTVLDPFMGSGSTLKAADLEGFSAIGIELDADYIEIARRRIASDAPLLSDVRTLSPIAAVSAQDRGGVCAQGHAA